jgi:hypothetical protein
MFYEMTFYHPQDFIQLVEFTGGGTISQSAYVSSKCEMTIKKRESDEFEIYSHQVDSIMDDKCILRVKCGGYFINEFCDSNGYEQILLLPLQSEYILDASTPMEFQKRMLFSFITKCVLLHDKCLFGHGSNSIQLSRMGEEILFMQLPVMKVPSDDNVNLAFTPISRVSTLDDQGQKVNDIIGEDNHTKSSSNNEGKQNWKETLRKAAQSRLYEELEYCKKQNDIANIEKYMNVRGRRALQHISIAGIDIDRAMPTLDIVKMTCSLESVSNRTSGLEATLFMNVDIALSKLSSVSTLYYVQLCISPHSKEHTQLNVQTNSAVIPIMRKQDCFTIMSSILVSNIKFEREVDIIDEKNNQIKFAVSVFFSDKQIRSDSLKPDMNGIILGFLSLPYESFVFHQKGVSHDSDDIIYTAPWSLSDTTESKAIFDYRVPRILFLDVSSSRSSNIENDWQSIIDSLNAYCIPGNRVDFHFNPEQMRVALSIFGSSLEHRLCLLRQAMRKIPHEVRIVGTNTCTWNQEFLVSALLENVEVELQLMNCCQDDSKEGGSRKILNNLFMAKSINDEIASMIAEQYDQEAFP